MKRLSVGVGFFVASSSLALACPACAVTSAQKDTWTTFWILSVMGIFPLIVALIIGLSIARIQRNDKIKIS